jgi:hypothetical protein|tara:strand:- start:1445 stop:2584 length:1140 start_codon:yes stop_codon:yes gene_type:complete
MYKLFFSLLPVVFLSCSIEHNQIELILKDPNPLIKNVYQNNEKHNLQILYTEIKKDSAGHPELIEHQFQVDDTKYFYPASTMKLPIVVLTLQRLNELRNESINADVDSRISISFDDTKREEETFTDLIAKIFLVSDNSASNVLINFLGYDYFNEQMKNIGLSNTVLNHKFNPDPFVKNNWNVKNDEGITISSSSAQTLIEHNKTSNLKQGNAHISNGEKKKAPLDFRFKNRSSLRDLDGVIKRIIYPELFDEKSRFNLTDDDYNFLRYWMSRFTYEDIGREYIQDSTYFDSYNKFFIYGDITSRIDRKIRVYNKLGQAYGTLTDISYIKNYEDNIEFFLSATIYVNDNEIMNDDVYEYDDLGIPFLAELARQFYKFEEE